MHHPSQQRRHYVLAARQQAAQTVPKASKANMGLSSSATIMADHTGCQGMIVSAGQGMAGGPRRGVPLELAGLVHRSATGREVDLRHLDLLSGVCCRASKSPSMSGPWMMAL